MNQHVGILQSRVQDEGAEHALGRLLVHLWLACIDLQSFEPDSSCIFEWRLSMEVYEFICL